MATQSRADPVPLLLTRPTAQGADFAQRIAQRFGDKVKVIKTPLLTPRFLSPVLRPQHRGGAGFLQGRRNEE